MQSLKTGLPLSVAVVLVILIQGVAIGLLNDTAVSFDSNEYLALSHSLFSSHEYSAPSGLNGFDSFHGEAPTRMRQPLYPLVLTAIYWLPGGHIFPVLIFQALLVAACLIFVYKTAVTLLGKKFKSWSILFPVFYFPWLLLSAKVLSEALFTFLLWSAVYCITLFIEYDRNRYLTGAGILFGLLVLTKSVGVSVVLLSSVTFIGLKGFSNGIRDWFIMAACTFAVLLPWGVRNYIQMGTPTFLPSNSGYNLWVASRSTEAPWWSDSEEFKLATENWSNYYIDQTADSNFREIAFVNISEDDFLTIAKRACYRWFTGMFRFPGTGGIAGMNLKFIALAVIQSGMLILALVSLFRLKSSKAWLILLLPLVALSLALPISKGLTRYLLPALPVIALLAGQSVIDTAGLIRKNLKPGSLKR